MSHPKSDGTLYDRMGPTKEEIAASARTNELLAELATEETLRENAEFAMTRLFARLCDALNLDYKTFTENEVFEQLERELRDARSDLSRLRPVLAAAETYRACWLETQRNLDGDHDTCLEEEVMARDELFDALNALDKAVADD